MWRELREHASRAMRKPKGPQSSPVTKAFEDAGVEHFRLWTRRVLEEGRINVRAFCSASADSCVGSGWSVGSVGQKSQ